MEKVRHTSDRFSDVSHNIISLIERVRADDLDLRFKPEAEQCFDISLNRQISTTVIISRPLLIRPKTKDNGSIIALLNITVMVLKISEVISTDSTNSIYSIDIISSIIIDTMNTVVSYY